MKTLESYKEEFDLLKANKDFEAYERLAKACIEEYPNEELGYVELGTSYLFLCSVPKDLSLITTIEALIHKAISNDFYLLSLECFFYKNKDFVQCLYDEGMRNLGIVQQITEGILRIDQKFSPLLIQLGKMHFENRAYDLAESRFNDALELKANYKEFIEFLNPKVGSFKIENYFCLKDIELQNLKDKKEIYLLGENGVGKTLLLKAFIRCLTQWGFENDYDEKDYNKLTTNTQSIENTYSRPSQNQTQDEHRNERHFSSDILEPQKTLATRSNYRYRNLFAYGTNRTRASYSSGTIAHNGYSTLFDRDALLLNPVDAFRKIRLNQTDGDGKLDIELVFKFISTIINFDDGKSFRIEREKAQFIFYELDTPTEFENLADGYRCVLLWLCDLIIRLSENQPYITDLKDFYGIVMVDEVDLFLHPKWEYKIVSKLREVLPNIQWIFTTHSPMLILGASEDAVFYKVYKVDGVTQVSDQFVKSDFMDYLLNGIVTSPLFDIDPSDLYKYVDEVAGIYTGDFINGKIYNQIRERLKNKPEKIDTMIDWINEALDEHENPA